MSVLLGVSKETVASSWMAADRSTGHRRYQDEAERSGPPVVFLVIQIISPCLPVVEGSVRPLDDFHETARAKKNAGILSRRASRRRLKGILATISASPRTRRTAVCVPREAHARPGRDRPRARPGGHCACPLARPWVRLCRRRSRRFRVSVSVPVSCRYRLVSCWPPLRSWYDPCRADSRPAPFATSSC